MGRYLKLMRFDKPIGTVLLFWPVCWAMLLAYQNHPPVSVIIVFSLGVILTRAAGCIINDLCDRNLDVHVARTQDRPLANGSVSIRQAYGLLALLGLSLLSLLFFINPMNQLIALLAAGLTVVYPLSKRFFAFPQLILGITFNIGVIMVFVQAGTLSIQAWAMYAASVAWTFSYDTVYAFADIADDARIGIHSSALSLGKYAHAAVCAGYVLMFMLLGFALKHVLTGCIIAILFLIIYGIGGRYSLKTWSTQSPIHFFKANAVLGAIIAFIVLKVMP